METKTLTLDRCEVKFAPAEGRFSGYGSVFGVKDSHKDVIMPGAFADVIKTGNPVMLYVNHGWMRGDLPVGKWDDLQEDSVGLKGESAVEMRMPAAANGYYALKGGLVTGLSIGYIADPSGTERQPDGTRVIHRMKALKEISIVDQPSNVYARVTDIKSVDELEGEIEQLKSARDLESFLRDAGGLSKGAAMALTARAKVIFGLGEPGHGDAEAKALAELSQRFQRLQEAISV
jgi:HK97 family phage prohead protease